MTLTCYYVIQVVIVLALVTSFILKDTPLGFFWNLFKLLIIGMLISFGIDFLKKGAKDWWNR